jgi:GNAT superfamily N-acetyltransferase
VPDRAGAVDYVGDPAGEQAEHGRHPVGLADAAALVGQQRERQPVLAREAGVPVRRVGADPDHLGPGVGERLVAVAEGARLGGAAGGVVLGVEVQDDHPLAEPVLQPDLVARLRREGEIGGLVAGLDAACHAGPASLWSPLGPQCSQG